MSRKIIEIDTFPCFVISLHPVVGFKIFKNRFSHYHSLQRQIILVGPI